jgi:hypothetical protein
MLAYGGTSLADLCTLRLQPALFAAVVSDRQHGGSWTLSVSRCWARSALFEPRAGRGTGAAVPGGPGRLRLSEVGFRRHTGQGVHGRAPDRTRLCGVYTAAPPTGRVCAGSRRSGAGPPKDESGIDQRGAAPVILRELRSPLDRKVRGGYFPVQKSPRLPENEADTPRLDRYR